MEEVRVSGWLELQEWLFADAWHEELSRHRSDFCFRGENDAANVLTTSLMRLGGEYASLEQHLLRSFRRYAPRREVPVDSLWNRLALAKHHNLPTRLLDWSYSPTSRRRCATSTGWATTSPSSSSRRRSTTGSSTSTRSSRLSAWLKRYYSPRAPR